MALLLKSKFLRQLQLKYESCLARIRTSSFGTTQTSKQTLDIDDKIALITGGSKGIGYCVAQELLRNNIGAVTIVDNDGEKSQESMKELAKEFGEDKILFVEADVADSKQLDKAFKKTILHYDAVNLVVNNAGIMNDTKWERQIKTNLAGTVIGTLLGMQYMSKSSSGEGGTVINIASVMSILPSSGYPLHTMTQFGIVGFTRALGCGNHFQRTGVKILALCPGLTNTQLLTEAPSNAINDNFSKEFLEETDGCEIQRPECVATGLLAVLEDSKPGSVWVTENNAPPYEVTFPEIAKIKQKKLNA